MTDLSAKFSTFESQSSTQHAELMAALASTNAKLDALLGVFGVPPPTATVSLADVLAAIEAGNAVLSDVHTDTQSMDGKLLVLRNTLSDVHLDTQSQDLKLLQIRDILSGMDDYLSVPNPVIAQIYASIGAALGTAIAAENSYLASINTSNAGLLEVLGNPADDTKSILRWIEDIAACACADPNAVPTLDDCVDPFASTGIVLTPFSFVGFADVAVAVWTGPLPEGISFGTTFGVEEDHTSLYSDDWSGWRVYVQSSEFNAAYTPTSADRYPTNTWQAFPAGAAEYSFAVRGQGNIKVIICPTGPSAPICTDYPIGPSEVVRIGWHAVPVTIQIIDPSSGSLGMYFWRWTDESVHIDRTLSGSSDVAQYLDAGHIAIQNASATTTVTVRVCAAYPGTEPHE